MGHLCDLFLNQLRIIIEIDPGNFGTRRHHGVDGPLSERQDPTHHVALFNPKRQRGLFLLRTRRLDHDCLG